MYDQLENAKGCMGEGNDALVNAVVICEGGEAGVVAALVVAVAACVVVVVVG